jgi:hypothetical protein
MKLILKQTLRAKILKTACVGGINEFKQDYHPRTNLLKDGRLIFPIFNM